MSYENRGEGLFKTTPFIVLFVGFMTWKVVCTDLLSMLSVGDETGEEIRSLFIPCKPQPIMRSLMKLTLLLQSQVLITCLFVFKAPRFILSFRRPIESSDTFLCRRSKRCRFNEFCSLFRTPNPPKYFLSTAHCSEQIVFSVLPKRVWWSLYIPSFPLIPLVL